MPVRLTETAITRATKDVAADKARRKAIRLGMAPGRHSPNLYLLIGGPERMRPCMF